MGVWTGSGTRSTKNKKWIWVNKKRMLKIGLGGRRRKPVVIGPGKAAKSRKAGLGTHTHPQRSPKSLDFSAVRK